jgi:hypothetical protein
VHQASQGLTLSQPNNDVNVPYEMKFTVHPPHESFCVKKIALLSEARNLELYVNGGYEKSTRGIMLTLNKERWGHPQSSYFFLETLSVLLMMIQETY